MSIADLLAACDLTSMTERRMLADALEESGRSEEAYHLRRPCFCYIADGRILAPDINCCEDMKRIQSRNGMHFFDRDTMRFFGSRLGSVYNGPGGIYFTTSENNFDRTARLYCVRRFNPVTGDVDTVDESFNKYKTSATARRIAQRLARGKE